MDSVRDAAKRMDEDVSAAEKSIGDLGEEQQKAGRKAAASVPAHQELTREVNKQDGVARKLAGAWKFVAAAVAAIGLTALTSQVVRLSEASVQAYADQVRAERQVSAVLASTQNSAGRTLRQLQDLAAGIQEVTTLGDEEVLRAASVLLTFTRITGAEFDRTTQAAADLAARMGGDLQSAIVQVGKALNDPIANLGELGRAGIQFTADQKALIKELWEGGRAAEAQQIILAELERQFQGSAAVLRGDVVGATAAFRNAWGDLLEQLGRSSNIFVPVIEEITDRLSWLNRNFLGIQQGIVSGSAIVAQQLVGVFQPIDTLVASAARRYADLLDLIPGMGSAAEVARGVAESAERGGRALDVFEEQIQLTAQGLNYALESFKGLNDQYDRAAGGGGGGGGAIQRTNDALARQVGLLQSQVDLMEEARSLIGSQLPASQGKVVPNPFLPIDTGPSDSELDRLTTGAHEASQRAAEDHADAIRDAEAATEDYTSAWVDAGVQIADTLRGLADGTADWQDVLQTVVGVWEQVSSAAQRAAQAQAAASASGGSSGGGSAASAASSASSFSSAGSSFSYASAAIAIYTAVYEGVSAAIEDSKSRRFALPVTVGASGTLAGGGQSINNNALSQADSNRLHADLQRGLQSILDLVGGWVNDMAEIGVEVRADGQKFKAIVGGEVLGVFDSIEDAIDQATIFALRRADFAGIGENVAAALRNSTAQTLQEYISDLEAGRRVDQLGMSALEIELQSLGREFLQLAEKGRRLGLDLSAIGDGQISAIQAMRDQILGIHRSEYEQRLDDARSFNRALLAMIDEQERYLNQLLAQFEAANTIGGIPIGDRGGLDGGPGGSRPRFGEIGNSDYGGLGGVNGVGSIGLGDANDVFGPGGILGGLEDAGGIIKESMGFVEASFYATAEAAGVAAEANNANAQGILDAINATRDRINGLRDQLIDEANVPRRIGGGNGQRREQRERALIEAGDLNAVANGISSAALSVRQTFRAHNEWEDAARKVGTAEEVLTQARLDRIAIEQQAIRGSVDDRLAGLGIGTDAAATIGGTNRFADLWNDFFGFYNELGSQAEELARQISEETGVPFEQALADVRASIEAGARAELPVIAAGIQEAMREALSGIGVGARQGGLLPDGSTAGSGLASLTETEQALAAIRDRFGEVRQTIQDGTVTLDGLRALFGEELVPEGIRLEEALRLVADAEAEATRALAVNFVQGLGALGVSMPTEATEALARAQWEVARAEALATANALHLAGALSADEWTMVVDGINNADFELSQFNDTLGSTAAAAASAGDAFQSAQDAVNAAFAALNNPDLDPTAAVRIVEQSLQQLIDAGYGPGSFYYDQVRGMLQDASQGLIDGILAGAEAGASSEAQRLLALTTAHQEQIRVLGVLGASEHELARLRRNQAEEIDNLFAEWLNEDSFTSVYAGLDALNERFDLLGTLAEQHGISLERVEAARQRAIEDFWDQQLSSINEIRNELRGGEFTSLSASERLANAQSEFESLAARAATGDADALQALGPAARALLEELDSFHVAGGALERARAEILGILDDVASLSESSAAAAALGPPANDNVPAIYEGLGNVTTFPTRPQRPIALPAPYLGQGNARPAVERADRQSKALEEIRDLLRARETELDELRALVASLARSQQRTETELAKYVTHSRRTEQALARKAG